MRRGSNDIRVATQNTDQTKTQPHFDVRPGQLSANYGAGPRCRKKTGGGKFNLTLFNEHLNDAINLHYLWFNCKLTKKLNEISKQINIIEKTKTRITKDFHNKSICVNLTHQFKFTGTRDTYQNCHLVKFSKV